MGQDPTSLEDDGPCAAPKAVVTFRLGRMCAEMWRARSCIKTMISACFSTSVKTLTKKAMFFKTTKWINTILQWEFLHSTERGRLKGPLLTEVMIRCWSQDCIMRIFKMGTVTYLIPHLQCKDHNFLKMVKFLQNGYKKRAESVQRLLYNMRNWVWS